MQEYVTWTADDVSDEMRDVDSAKSHSGFCDLRELG